MDVQIAAGLAGIEYPAGYGTLISRLLGAAANKEETRTDWRRRPLSQRQIEYALDDIRYLPQIRDTLHARLGELGRLSWLQEEMANWLEEVQWALSQERWRRVSGNSGLGRGASPSSANSGGGAKPRPSAAIAPPGACSATIWSLKWPNARPPT